MPMRAALRDGGRAALRDPRCSPNDEQLRDKSRAGCAPVAQELRDSQHNLPY